jgi:hypothetical protein
MLKGRTGAGADRCVNFLPLRPDCRQAFQSGRRGRGNGGAAKQCLNSSARPSERLAEILAVPGGERRLRPRKLRARTKARTPGIVAERSSSGTHDCLMSFQDMRGLPPILKRRVGNRGLLGAQRGQRVHPKRPSRWKITRQQRRGKQGRSHGDEDQRIESIHLE